MYRRSLTFVWIVALLAGCPSSGDDECAEGSRLVRIDGELQCAATCEESDCPDGQRCSSNVCIPGTATMQPVDAGTGDAGASDVAVRDVRDSPPDVGAPDAGGPDMAVDPLEAICDAAMYTYVDCPIATCEFSPGEVANLENYRRSILEGEGDYAPCVEEAATNQPFRSWLESIAAMECNGTQWRQLWCGEFGAAEQCGCTPPDTLGDACGEDADCDAGELTGPYCLQLSWAPGGYCTAYYCPVPQGAEYGDNHFYAGCGEGDVCAVEGVRNDTNGNGQIDTGDEIERLYGLCVDGCTAQSDCRDGYSCQLRSFVDDGTGAAQPLRICYFQCTDDSQCDNGTGTYRCNEDNGACEFRCLPPGDDYTSICTTYGGTCETDPSNSETYCVYP